MNNSAALRWTTAGLALAAFYVCWPLAPALVLAAWTAAIARPLFERFAVGLQGRRRGAAAVAILLLLVVAVPLVLVVLGAVSGAREIWQVIAASPSVKSALETIAAEGAAEGAGAQTGIWPIDGVPAIIRLVQSYGTQGFGLLSSVAGAATDGTIALLTYFGGVFVFLLDGPDLGRWLRRQGLLASVQLERFALAFHETGRGLLIGVGLTTAAQSLIASVVYLSLGVPRWWVLGLITGVATMLPIVGSTLVWGPLAVGLFLLGHPVKAAILVVLGFGVIGTVHEVLRPIFARWGALRMPVLLLFVAIIGGMIAFGPSGAILGPLIVRLLMEALALLREGAEKAGVKSDH